MQQFITALTGENGLSATTFWSQLAPAAPVILTLLGVAFGYYVVRRVIKGASKAKARI